MEDKQIIELFWMRVETAIAETSNKYGKYCYYIAYNILHNEQDSEECVNDTYLRAWNTIPPQKPNNLATYLGKITRNVALDKYRYYKREKRGQGQVMFVLEELEECLPAEKDTEQEVSEKILADAINSFLRTLPVEKRKIFMRRYWYFSSVGEIARDFSLSESNVKVILLRTRNKLKDFLEREGIVL